MSPGSDALWVQCSAAPRLLHRGLLLILLIHETPGVPLSASARALDKTLARFDGLRLCFIWEIFLPFTNSFARKFEQNQ